MSRIVGESPTDSYRSTTSSAGDDTAPALPDDDAQRADDGVSQDAKANQPAQHETSHRRKISSNGGGQQIVVVNQSTPIPSPPASPPPELADPPRSNKRLIFSGVISVFLLAIAFVGIFTSFGFVQCNCDNMRGWFTGLVMSVIAWWAPSPAKAR